MPEDIHSNCSRVDSDHVDFGINAKPEVDVERIRFPRKVGRDKKEFDNTYHPGVESADLVHEVHHLRVSKHKLHSGIMQPDLIESGMEFPKRLCHNCGWTTAHELGADGYTSRLNVSYLRQNSAIWELGSNGPWMLRDEPNNTTAAFETDYITQQFLRKEEPSLPVIEMHKYGGPDDKFHFTIMARAKGNTISTIWHTLTQEQKKDVLEDLKGCIRKWRQITRPYMQKVDGSELLDPFIGTCTGRGCVKTGRDENEWLENLTPAMRKGFLWHLWIDGKGCDADESIRASWIKEADRKIAQLKANFPKGGPFVLTHGDLHPNNIFISDDNEEKKFKISAVIDWELAGFFPWWAEFIRADVPDVFELLGPSSDIYYPGYDTKDWNKVWEAVFPVKDSWFNGGNHTFSIHKPDQANRWYRPTFCACKPYAQEYRDNQLGWEDEHLDVFDVDSTDSEDDEEDGWKKFPKRSRNFLRWFKEISNQNPPVAISPPNTTN